MRKRGVVLVGLSVAFASLLGTAPAEARNLYFDIWCQEQGYSKERCDQRLPEDVAAFEEYWRAVEKYEEEYYVQRQDYVNFRDELNALDEAPQPGFQNYDPDRSPRPN
jgi:hypothetical protein